MLVCAESTSNVTTCYISSGTQLLVCVEVQRIELRGALAVEMARRERRGRQRQRSLNIWARRNPHLLVKLEVE